MDVKPYLVSALVLPLIGCASMVTMDKPYLAQHASKYYDSTPKECYEAAKQVIIDMGGEVQKEKESELSFSSNRFVIQEVAIGDANSAKLRKEEHKLYIETSESGSGCEVELFKYRVWVDNRELDKVNENFIKPYVFQPFLNDIASTLSDDF